MATQPNKTPATPAPKATTPATQAVTTTPATTAPVKGAALRARWAAGCGKGNPNFVAVMPAQIKALPRNAVITLLQAGNPKRQGSKAALCFNKYGFNGIVGATTTLGAYITALEFLGGSNRAYQDVSWEVNRGFISIQGINGVPAAVAPVAPAAPASAAVSQAA